MEEAVVFARGKQCGFISLNGTSLHLLENSRQVAGADWGTVDRGTGAPPETEHCSGPVCCKQNSYDLFAIKFRNSVPFFGSVMPSRSVSDNVVLPFQILERLLDLLLRFRRGNAQ